MKADLLSAAIKNGGFDCALKALYGSAAIAAQRVRYAGAAEKFAALFGGGRDAHLFSVPGRSEISGNHTDHNNGRVLAAAVNLDIIAVAAKSDGNVINIKSEGFDNSAVDLENITPGAAERFTSDALIAGVCDGFKNNGYNIGAFDAYTTSSVAKGSGLSSSAAFEVMCGNILNHFYNGSAVSAPELAKISQYAENVFFGKPCGLMDQTACAVGGFVEIDFLDPANPITDKMTFDLSAKGYSLCVTNTGGNHADLNEDYASVPAEMKAVAAHFGKKTLRGLCADEVLGELRILREKTGDRALLRALHFIGENDRVERQTQALRSGDFGAFLDGVNESGRSSFMWLQNVYTTQNVSEQGISLALAVSESVLSKSGLKWGVRVHGGGFAGTVAAFVPDAILGEYRAAMDAAFGAGACTPLRIRAAGAVMLGDLL